jgi:flagellar basal-body rod protein FlgG
MIESPNGQRAYTRDGSLRIDSAGNIVTAAGRRLVIEPPEGQTGPAHIPLDATSVTIASDGVITYTAAGSDTPVSPGRVLLAVPVPTVPGRSADMLPLGGNLYTPSPETLMVTRAPGTDGAGELRQGYLERSNVSLMQEMTDLLQAQRAYELSARSIKTADEMLSVANSIWHG